MAWDVDDKGNIIAVPLNEFEVSGLPADGEDDGLVLVRLTIGATKVQLALSPEYASALAADLSDLVEELSKSETAS